MIEPHKAVPIATHSRVFAFGDGIFYLVKSFRSADLHHRGVTQIRAFGRWIALCWIEGE